MARLSIIVPFLLLVVAACASAPSTPSPGATPSSAPAASQTGLSMLPILASSELASGPNRFLFALTDRDGKPIAAPDVTVDLLFYDDDVDKDAVAFEAESRFLWAIEGIRGLYVANVDFPSDGRWGTRFNATFPDGSTQTVRADYDVVTDPHAPAIGEQAPSVDTPTAADVGGDLALLSTDDDPDPRFYETSIADALAKGEAFVVAFATPVFCQTATCGPMLETVKEVAQDFPDITFINVEPYVMAMQDGALRPVLDDKGQLQPAAWTTAWDLLTEPYLAVVGADGAVRATFEGAITPDELVAALESL